MDRKTFTLLIASNRKGTTRSLTFSAAWLKTFAALGVIAAIVLGAGVVDYLGLLLQVSESKQLKAENASLKNKFTEIESKVDSLESSLDRVKNFETKLKLITNIDDESRATKLAIGPMPPAGRSADEAGEAFGERDPASEFLIKADEDSKFLEDIPVDEAKGELTRLAKTEYASLSVRIDGVIQETQLREKGILNLLGTLSETQSLLLQTPSVKPVRGWFTSQFGYRADPFSGKLMMHAGLDIAAPPGTPVYAPADGMVSYVGYEAGYGKIVSIDHGYGVRTRYAHNSQVFVEVGQKVKRWDTISLVGTTGRSSGPHLHYEVRVHDLPVDPINYVLDE